MTNTEAPTTHMGCRQEQALGYLAALGPSGRLRRNGLFVSNDTIDRCIRRGWLAEDEAGITLTDAGFRQARGDGRTSNVAGGVLITADPHHDGTKW